MYRHSGNALNEDGLALKGYQKKLKTMKKKFFVLYKDTNSDVARLEYYDNERKFKSGMPPKRIIKLKNCFNINRRLDTRYDFVISLSTKDGAFGIVLETESEMIKWLETLISLQRNDLNTSDESNPQFEHFWQVTIERRGLAEEKGLIGNYYVGLTAQSLIFIRIGAEKTLVGEKRLPKVEFPLNTIRRCGDSQCYFYVEVGRKSIIGPGEFWMKTENSQTAESMHSKILSAMSLKSEATNSEPMRKRSASATEASKPINVLQRRQNQTDNKMNSPQAVIGFSRERCDSLPSRNRTSSECNSQNLAATSTLSVRNFTMSGLRSHSYQRHSNSPPMNATIGCSESEESSVSIDEPDDNGSFIPFRFNSRSSEGVIPEENTDELLGVESKQGISKGFEYNDTKPESLSSLGTNEESYLSMAPVNTYKDSRIKSAEECRYVPSNSSSIRGGVPSSIMEFPEYIFDKMSKTVTNETDLQFERPTRAYSIGSKVEHTKFNKRATNFNDLDQNTVRVRAFSVGSRAKIPRCDLQRGVFAAKSSTVEHNTNNSSNNNICTGIGGIGGIAHHHMANNTSCSEQKKSISAPLLIHKSHNSVDRMSDLMEIDFSKSSNNSSSRIYSSARMPIGKNVLLSNRDRDHQTIKNDNLIHSSSPSSIVRAPTFEENAPTPTPTTTTTTTSMQKSFSPIIESAVNQTDNGYLEMKPVGDTLIKNSPTKHYKDSSNIYSAAASIIGSAKKTALTSVPEKMQPKSYIIQPPVLLNRIGSSSAFVGTGTGVGGGGEKEISIIEKVKQTQQQQQQQQDNKKDSNTDTDSKMKDDFPEKAAVHKQTSSFSDQKSTKSDKAELNIKEQNKTNILTQNLTKDLNHQKQQKQVSTAAAAPATDSSKDDYINIIQKTNEQISAHLKNKRLNTLSLLTTHHHTMAMAAMGEDNNKHDELARKSSLSTGLVETGGYEILQIKSDSSLQSHKSSLNRHNNNNNNNNNNNHNNNNNRKDKQQQQLCQQIPSRPRSTNSSSAMQQQTSSNLSGYTYTSSSTSCLMNYNNMPTSAALQQHSTPTTLTLLKGDFNNSQTQMPKVNNASSSTVTATTTTTTTTTNPSITSSTLSATTLNTSPSPLNLISRPPSVSSEHQLHYATLDLPTVSDIGVKLNKLDVTSHGSSPIAELATTVNNCYAKIDFDVSSDSSSLSSKNNVNN